MTAAEPVKKLHERFSTLRAEVGKVLVGQEEMLERLLIGFIAGGHVLLEGVPGVLTAQGVHQEANGALADLDLVRHLAEPGTATALQTLGRAGAIVIAEDARLHVGQRIA
ncbi:MAG: hypothetical protein AAGC55_02475, partial [Myxococcota bacterium]